MIVIVIMVITNGRVAVCGTRIVAGDVRGAVMKWQIAEGEEVSCFWFVCLEVFVFVFDAFVFEAFLWGAVMKLQNADGEKEVYQFASGLST